MNLETMTPCHIISQRLDFFFTKVSSWLKREIRLSQGVHFQTDLTKVEDITMHDVTIQRRLSLAEAVPCYETHTNEIQ